jgi:hypothetical protein
MKKTRKLLGLAAIIAAIALNTLLMTGCSLLPEADLAVVRIEITKLPTKTTYNSGESLNTAGMVVTATYEDGTSKEVNGYTTSYDTLAVGQVPVTVTYKDKTATFTITVKPDVPAKTLSSIAVTPPTKTTYNIGENFDPAGMVVTATYSDGSTEAVTVTAANISGFSSTTAGEKTVTVTYQDKTAEFKVNVQAAIPSFPSGVYGITGSGTTFTAFRNDATIGTADQSIQTVINGIRTHANGQAATIQFGDGTTALSIGEASISFNNTGGTWGAVTLRGKITSSNATYTIYIDTVSITSSADIANTTSANTATGDTVRNEGTLTITGGTVQADQVAVRNGFNTSGTLNISGGTVKANGNYSAVQNGNSTVNISGGTVSASGGGRAIYILSAGIVNITGGTVSTSGAANAIYNDTNGTINISSGTVQAASGYAVDNGTGKITVSGTTTKVTSANGTATINLRGGSGSTSAGTERLVITGGTVENTSTSTNARTIYNNGNGAVTISGGAVTGTAGKTIELGSTGTINISGGTVSATSGIAVNNGSTGKITVSGTAKITSRNTNSSEGTIRIGDAGTVNSIRLEITGGTVENTLSIPGSSGGYAIYNAHSAGSQVVSITGGTIGKQYGTQ